jgi:hypothetical protein
MISLGYRITAAVVAIVFASAGPAAATASKSIKLELKLPPKPPFPRPEIAAPLTAGPIMLTVSDARGLDDAAVVGGQRVQGEDVYLWRATGPVEPAVREQATTILHAWSVRVAPEADFGLKLRLATYHVDEQSEKFGSTYLADVGFHVSLVDKTGKERWSGEAAGSAKRSGVDGRASMGNEALSMALRDALAKTMTSASAGAFASNAKSPPTPAPPGSPSRPIVIEPDALLADLERLAAGGVTDDVLVAYVEQRRLARPLSVDDILRWKNSGIPDAAI